MSLNNIPDRFRQRIQAAKNKRLETLDLSDGQLTQIPKEVFQVTHLKKLNLSNNQLTNLSNLITKLSHLTTLDLSNNQLVNLPGYITRLSRLTTLNLSNNQLTNLYESRNNVSKYTTRFSHLTTLDLSNNKLVNLPEYIGTFYNLTKLDLSNNQLVSFPEFLIKLSNLKELNLGSNQLINLPKSIDNLPKLTKLNLYNNKLKKIPESITNLSSLNTLDLRINKLKKIPESITNLPNLTTLDLNYNPLETPPLEIANKGIKAIRKYFLQIKKEGIDHIYEAKLLIVGEGGAGKTTLAKKIEDKHYRLDNHEKSTEGIDIIKWRFLLNNKQEFKVNIWDFGGQEIYHATHQFFLTKRSLYTLVVDNRKENNNLYYWLNLVELLSDNSPLLIIKNKKQDRQREINERALRSQFNNLEKTLPTNLATNDGLDDIIIHIKHYISTLDHIGSALPKTWVKVRQALENDERNHISLDEYLTLCQNNGFTNLPDKLQLSEYLHDLGVCLHFQDQEDSLLYKTVILKPEWGTNAVYTVLDNSEVIKNQGFFTGNDLKNIWHEEKYSAMRGELLELMKKFQLCYRIPGSKDSFIAPQLLSDNQPDYDWDESNNLILRYTYEFMPKGIITQLIVAMHQHIHQQQYVWKSGVLLNKDKTLAEVIKYYDKRELKIRLSGKFKKDLLTIITHELNKIHSSYSRLKYSQLIPCNCSICKNKQEPHFYKFEELRRFKEHRQLKIQCRTSFEMVDVLSLIDDVIIPFNSEQSHSAQHPSQYPTKTENHFHGNVGTVTGTIEGNQHSGDTNITGDHALRASFADRNIKIGQGNYNESIKGNYYEQKGNNNNMSNINQYGKGDNIAGDKVMGDKIGTQINNSQNLAQAAHDIKELLNQLAVDYPDQNPVAHMMLSAKVVEKIENNPSLKQKVTNALKEAGTTALESAIDHPAAKVLIAGVKGYMDA